VQADRSEPVAAFLPHCLLHCDRDTLDPGTACRSEHARARVREEVRHPPVAQGVPEILTFGVVADQRGGACGDADGKQADEMVDPIFRATQQDVNNRDNYGRRE
jgi:hypothetical protein